MPVPYEVEPVAIADERASENVPGASTLRAYISLAILVLLTMISYMDRTILQLLVAPIQADLHITDVQYSLITGLAFAGFFALLTIPCGWLADRISRRWLIFFGVSGWSFATAAGGLASSFGQLFVSRMFVGVGEATLGPAGYAIVGRIFPKHRQAMAAGILAAGASLGSAAALVVGGLVIAWAGRHHAGTGFSGWQLSLVLIGLPGLLVAPLVFIIPEVPERRLPRSADGDRRGFVNWLLRHWRYMLPMSLASGCAAALLISVASWLPALLTRRYGLGPVEIGSYLAMAFGGAGAIGFVSSGWLVDRLAARARDVHLRYATVVTGSTGVIGMLAFSLADSVTPLLLSVALMSFVTPINAAVLAHLQSCAPAQYRGRAIALLMLVLNLVGISVGASFPVLVSDRFLGGPQHLAGGIAIACGVLGACSAILFALSVRPGRRAQAALETGDRQP